MSTDEAKRLPGTTQPIGSGGASIGAPITADLEGELGKLTPELRDRVRAVVARKREQPR